VETAPQNWVIGKYDLRPGSMETAPHNWTVCKYYLIMVRWKHHHTTELFDNATSDLVRSKQHHTTGLFANMYDIMLVRCKHTAQQDCLKIRPQIDVVEPWN
jgi:hypothetical protein